MSNIDTLSYSCYSFLSLLRILSIFIDPKFIQKTLEVDVMKHGDFTKLAKKYGNRPGYSQTVLNVLSSYVNAYREDFRLAEIGAGTGKLTKNLQDMGFRGFAVEPNCEMRQEGIKFCKNNCNIGWSTGSGEETSLEDSSVDWVLMASSFHWTDFNISLPEFHRILKPGGFFTCMWNPRNLSASKFHQQLEQKLFEIAPNIKRISSGGKKYTDDIEKTLTSTGHFTDVVFVECSHEVTMTKERYIGAWRSVNDIQVQAGKAKFERIMDMIEKEISYMDYVVVPYKTRSWTARATGN